MHCSTELFWNRIKQYAVCKNSQLSVVLIGPLIVDINIDLTLGELYLLKFAHVIEHTYIVKFFYEIEKDIPE